MINKIKKLLILIGKPFFIIIFFIISNFVFVFVALNKYLIRKIKSNFVKLFNKKNKKFTKQKKLVKTKKTNKKSLFLINLIFLKNLKNKLIKYLKIKFKTKRVNKKLPILDKKDIKTLKAKEPINKGNLIKGTIVLLFFATISFLFYFIILKDLPSPKKLVDREQEVSTKIYDRNGELLYVIYKNKNRTPVKLNDVPQSLILATLAAEDAEFYNHPGFSLKGIIRALKKNIENKKLEGGSTITQQLVKNALLSSEKTYIRKIRELILSIGVEIHFSKNEILEMYLNEVNYGGTIYGIQEASRHYFAKEVWDLTLEESALLAGLPQSPTKYSPFGPNPELSIKRQKEVLNLMRINGYITKEQEEQSLSKALVFAENKQKIKAPHFVMYIKEQLIDKYGEEVVGKGGLTVNTTLDLEIQNLAEKIVNEEIQKLKGLNVTNAAVIVLDVKTNQILAMVGSVDYFNMKNGGNVNVTLRPRQPGSSIKVINYALALKDKYTLSTIIDDSPITYKVLGQKPYSPKNYDGKYRGKISIRQALAESRNIPAVKVLSTVGVKNMIDLGEKMGITTWQDRSRFGLSLTLGGGETKLIDMAKVYSTIANYGKVKEINSIVSIYNSKNNLIFEPKEINQEQVIDPRISYLLIDVLKDNESRSVAFGSNSMLKIPNHPEVAVKTGTSNDLKDNLTIGFNSDYLVAVWVGNNDGSSMSRISSGITGAAPIWNRIMTNLISNSKSKSWMVPEGLVKKECFSKHEWFLEEKQMSCPKIIEPASVSVTE